LRTSLKCLKGQSDLLYSLTTYDTKATYKYDLAGQKSIQRLLYAKLYAIYDYTQRIHMQSSFEPVTCQLSGLRLSLS
jgi:hypothetical protein